jgi:hypothetical protein
LGQKQRPYVSFDVKAHFGPGFPSVPVYSSPTNMFRPDRIARPKKSQFLHLKQGYVRGLFLLSFLFLTGCIREDRLTLGKGESLILFEEFLCPACQHTIHSELEGFVSDYVEKGKIQLTIIPTAFFESSRPSFTAFHQIHKYSPSLLYPFFLFIYRIPQEKLVLLSAAEILTCFHTSFPFFNVNKAIQSIDEKEVTRCIEINCAHLERFYEEEMHLPTYIFKGKTIAGGNLLPLMIEFPP